ncbi:MAG: sulfurtransferase-like selenium metabolism protein YedF, partial [Acidobacteriota bacterium]|nr:sulfurtransferase-like selenium metabolism protein YedF [Acidobacteriota bacterium]
VRINASGDSTGARSGEEALMVSEVSRAADGPRVVQITAGTMGSGDDELGALLLRSFLKTQAELEQKPDAILFYNDGVKLCCEGSYLLDDLRELEATGVEIIACGTCLNFFELSEQLRVGRVTDMLEIAGRLAEAGSIVRP